MYFYKAYTLRIASQLKLPELSVWHEGAMTDSDVHIVAGPIDDAVIQALPQVGPYLYADTRNLVLTVPDIATFLIEDGQRITYDAISDSEDDTRTFLLGSCLGALLMQRGLFLLHGCAIKIDQGIVACVGPSTYGKSTIAAAFMKNGYAVAADDVCAVTADAQVLPGIPRIKINRDVAKKLDIDIDGLASIRADSNHKFSLPLGLKYCSEPMPLMAVYQLAPDKNHVGLADDLGPLQRVSVFNRNAYRPRYVRAAGRSVAYFKRSHELAKTVRVAKLCRSLSEFNLDELQTLILNDVKNHLRVA